MKTISKSFVITLSALAFISMTSTAFADTQDIQPGGGIISSPNRVAPSVCYAAQSVGTSERQSFLQVGVDFNDLLSTIRYSYSNPGAYGTIEQSYMLSLQEDDKSKTYGTVFINSLENNLNLSGAGLDALNPVGKQYYNSNPQDPSVFDKNCGDRYIKVDPRVKTENELV